MKQATRQAGWPASRTGGAKKAAPKKAAAKKAAKKR